MGYQRYLNTIPDLYAADVDQKVKREKVRPGRHCWSLRTALSSGSSARNAVYEKIQRGKESETGGKGRGEYSKGSGQGGRHVPSRWLPPCLSRAFSCSLQGGCVWQVGGRGLERGAVCTL
jgi:hypothetical protein